MRDGRRGGVLAGMLALALCLAGCAGPKYTVDDGRKVDEVLLGHIRAWGDGERALRPAVARSAALGDPDCDRQWELPFAVASSDGWSEVDRVAWVRGLGVDERVTVVAAAPGSPLPVGSRIARVGAGGGRSDAEFLLDEIARFRDFGRPFAVTLHDGTVQRVVPFEVCRGYARFVPPNTPELQDYHWLLLLHPLEVARAGLSDDEALWVVLWSQGLSEEGGLRMKAYDYGRRLVGTLYNLATLATGLKSAALAADAAVKAAQAAASKAATEVIKQQLIEQGKSLALDRLREGAADAADRMARQQAAEFAQRAAFNRSGLGGLSRVAATVFDRADTWALERAQRLQADPLAGFTLHQKLADRGLSGNAFALDAERMAALSAVAEKRGLGEQVAHALRGVRPSELEAQLTAMPLASRPAAFRYDLDEPMDAGPYGRGLVDALVRMPVASRP